MEAAKGAAAMEAMPATAAILQDNAEQRNAEADGDTDGTDRRDGRNKGAPG